MAGEKSFGERLFGPHVDALGLRPHTEAFGITDAPPEPPSPDSTAGALAAAQAEAKKVWPYIHKPENRNVTSDAHPWASMMGSEYAALPKDFDLGNVRGRKAAQTEAAKSPADKTVEYLRNASPIERELWGTLTGKRAREYALGLGQAYEQAPRTANMGAAMANLLGSRGMSHKMADLLMGLHGQNVDAGNKDADRVMGVVDRLLQGDTSEQNNALSNLTQLYGVNTQKDIEGGKTEAALAAAQAEAQRYASQGEETQFNNFLDFAASRLNGNGGLEALRDPKTMADMLEEYNQAFRYFGRRGKGEGMKDGGRVQSYAGGGEVEAMLGALEQAPVADPVAEGAPASMESGDYVIPADVLRFYGLKFFQSMIQKAEDAAVG